MSNEEMIICVLVGFIIIAIIWLIISFIVIDYREARDLKRIRKEKKELLNRIK